MLFDISTGKAITRLPHETQFHAWTNTSRLSASDYEAILYKIDQMINGDEIHTAGWMPGNNWSGTPFQTIYEKACQYNENSAALCFGQFVFLAFMHRNEAWACGRYEKDGIPIQSLTYFRVPKLDASISSARKIQIHQKRKG